MTEDRISFEPSLKSYTHFRSATEAAYPDVPGAATDSGGPYYPL